MDVDLLAVRTVRISEGIPKANELLARIYILCIRAGRQVYVAAEF